MCNSFKKAPIVAASGTCLQGKVKTTFHKLIDSFGEPIYPDSIDGKVICEWILEFDCGTIATIYCWKLKTIPVHEHEWNIGGRSERAVECVEKFLNPSA